MAKEKKELLQKEKKEEPTQQQDGTRLSDEEMAQVTGGAYSPTPALVYENTEYIFIDTRGIN